MTAVESIGAVSIPLCVDLHFCPNFVFELAYSRHSDNIPYYHRAHSTAHEYRNMFAFYHYVAFRVGKTSSINFLNLSRKLFSILLRDWDLARTLIKNGWSPTHLYKIPIPSSRH